MKTIKNIVSPGFLAVTACLVAPVLPIYGAVTNVTVANDSFTPSTANIHAGDQVVWTWASGAANHNVVSTSSPFAWLFPSPNGSAGTTSNQNSSNLRNSPFSFTNTFTTAGSFPYECTEHASFGMVGTVNVTAPAVTPTIAITNPVAGAVFSAPASLSIEAAAAISSGAVTNVQFLLGSTVLTNRAAAPYVAQANNLVAGSYQLSAIASGDDGLKATNAINITVVTPGPIVAGTPLVSAPGTFQFTYSATVGLTYVVQSSTNLIDWTALATNTATVNPEVFTDNRAAASTSFYRVELLPNP